MIGQCARTLPFLHHRNDILAGRRLTVDRGRAIHAAAVFEKALREAWEAGSGTSFANSRRKASRVPVRRSMVAMTWIILQN